MTEQAETAEGTIDGVPFTYEQAKVVAAREAAAEARALRDAADALSAVSTHPVGWLRDRADRIAARAAAAAAGGGGEA